MAPQSQITDIEELAWLKERVVELEKQVLTHARASGALEESRRLFDSFLFHTPAIAWMKDELGRYVFANRRFHEFVSETGATCIGSSDFDLWPAPVAERLRANDAAVANAIETMGGKQFTMQRFKFQGASGRFYVGGIGVDVTREETGMLRSQKLESLGLIAGGVAHDINNLLATIMGNASLSLDALTSEHAAWDPLGEVVIASRRASDLTQQVLAYSGRAQIVIKAVDLSVAVREIGNLLETTISKKIDLTFELADGLPPIDADEGQLQQIIMNLVINASDAIGEKPGRIMVRTREHEGVCFEVRDTGCGMSAATKERIFDPFFTTKSNGRGLGLAAALGIVRNHGGTLQVESEPGMGTTFCVTFPVGKSRLVRTSGEALKSDVSGTETILVADDDDGIRRMTQMALERLGYKILLATNGQEAVEVFRENRKDIAAVLIDWAMPVMNGEEALLRIFEMDPAAVAIMSSGYAETDTLQQLGPPLAAFVQKPYTTTTLARKLRDVLDRQRL